MRNLFWGILLVMLGTLLLLDNLEVADFGEMITTYWPLFLIALGASILFRRRSAVQQPSPQPEVAAPLPSSTDDLIHQSNVFGDIVLTSSSQNFKGGSISTVFGNSILNLSKAIFAAGDHELRVHGVFGNSVIIIPKDSAVSVVASSTFGEMVILGQRKGGISSDMQVATPQFSSSPNRLSIHITKVFGDVRVE